MTSFQAAVFDLDGVLFDTEPIHRAAWMDGLLRVGHRISEASLMEWTGVPCKSLAQHYARELEPHLPWQDYFRLKQEALQRLAREQLRPYPGIADRLTLLSESLPLGFATSNSRVDAELMLDIAGLSSFFRAGVTYDDVCEHKPHSAPYVTAAEALGVPAEWAVGFEDSPSGVASARSAGMYVLGITTTFDADVLADANGVFPSTVSACDWLQAHIGSAGPGNRSA